MVTLNKKTEIVVEITSVPSNDCVCTEGKTCSPCRERRMLTQGYWKCLHFELCNNWMCKPAEGQVAYCRSCRKTRCHIYAPGTHSGSGTLLGVDGRLLCEGHANLTKVSGRDQAMQEIEQISWQLDLPETEPTPRGSKNLKNRGFERQQRKSNRGAGRYQRSR